MKRALLAIGAAVGVAAVPCCAPADFTFVSGADAGDAAGDRTVPPDGAGDASVEAGTQWARGFGQSGPGSLSVITAKGLVVDDAGTLYTAGWFGQSADFGDGRGVITANGGFNIYLLALAPDGGTLWATPYVTPEDAGGAGSAITALASHPSGLVAAGFFNGVLDLGTSALDAGPLRGALVAGFSPDAGAEWATTFVGTDNVAAVSLAVDPRDDSIVVAGNFAGRCAFGGTMASANGFQDVFLATFNAAHAFQGALEFGGMGTEDPTAVAVDSVGTRTIVGSYQGAIGFGAIDGGSSNADGSSDIFVASVDANGLVRWLYLGGGVGDDEASAVAVDGNGDVYVTGYFASTISFDKHLTGGGGFVAKLSRLDGTPSWSTSFGGGATTSKGTAIGMVAGTPDLVVGGTADSLTTFGGPSLGRGGFVARLNTADGGASSFKVFPSSQAVTAAVVETASDLYAAGTFVPPLGEGGPLFLDGGGVFVLRTSP